MLAGDESALPVACVAVGVVRGVTEDADPARLFVPAYDAVVRNVAPQETAGIAEIDRTLVKAATGREPLDACKREPVFVEGRIETLHRWVGIALARLPGRQCSGVKVIAPRTRAVFEAGHERDEGVVIVVMALLSFAEFYIQSLTAQGGQRLLP